MKHRLILTLILIAIFFAFPVLSLDPGVSPTLTFDFHTLGSPLATPTTVPTFDFSSLGTPAPGATDTPYSATQTNSEALKAVIAWNRNPQDDPTLVQFYSSASTGNPAYWEWTFGDGSVSYDKNPAHRYPSGGTYQVTLFIRNQAGETSSAFLSVPIPIDESSLLGDIGVKPAASITWTVVSPSDPAVIQFTPSLSAGTPTSWKWEFGDGSKSNEWSPSHRYQEPGTYIVTFSAGNDAGSTSSKATLTIMTPTTQVQASARKPVAVIRLYPGSASDPTLIHFDSKLSSGTPDSFSWDFGDGSGSREANPAHRYPGPGNYTILLTVTNSGGSDSSRITFVIPAGVREAGTPPTPSANLTGPSDTMSPYGIGLILPLAIILVLCASLGMGYSWFRRKSPDIPPEQQAPSPGSQKEAGSQEEIRRITTRFEYITKKASSLEIFGKHVQDLLSKAQEHLLIRDVEGARAILDRADSMFGEMKQYELNLSSWRSRGYSTSSLDTLQNKGRDEVAVAFREYERNVVALEELNRKVLDLKRSHPHLLDSPEIEASLKKIDRNSKDPLKVDESGKLLSEVTDRIETLERLQPGKEALESWSKEGYSIPPPDAFPSEGDYIAFIGEVDVKIKSLKKVRAWITGLQADEPDFLLLPEIHPSIEKIQENLYNTSATDEVLLQAREIDRHLARFRTDRERKCREATESVRKLRAHPGVAERGELWLTQVEDALSQGDCTGAELLLGEWTREFLSALDNDLAEAKKQNIVTNIISDPAARTLKEGRYADSLITIESLNTGLVQKKQKFFEAKSLKEKFHSSYFTEIFDAGNYDEFIKETEKTEEMIARWNDAVEGAEHVVNIPASILAYSANPDPVSLSHAFTELETFQKSARPVLTVSIPATQFTAGKWYKTNVTLTNTGTAHAFNVDFSFSEEFEAKRIKPTQIKAGETGEIEIGLLPRNAGTIPFEITVHYSDGHAVEYTENHEFWIEVVDPTAVVHASSQAETPVITSKTETGAEKRTHLPVGMPDNPGTNHDVFITYSHKDKPVADAICASLENNNIRCWIAPRDVLPGENFPEAIIEAITRSRVMVLIYSSHSNTSPHVIRELTKAVSCGSIIIPFRIEDAPLSKSMEYLIGLPHWLDALTPPLEYHIGILVDTVIAVLKSRE